MSVVEQKMPLTSGIAWGSSSNSCNNSATDNVHANINFNGNLNNVTNSNIVHDQYGAPVHQSYSIVASTIGQNTSRPVLPPLHMAIHSPYGVPPMMGATHSSSSTASSLSISSMATGSSPLLPLVLPPPTASAELQAKRSLDRFLFTGPDHNQVQTQTQIHNPSQGHYFIGSEPLLPSTHHHHWKAKKSSSRNSASSLSNGDDVKVETLDSGKNNVISNNDIPRSNIAGSMNSSTSTSPSSSSYSTPIASKSKRSSRQDRKPKASQQHKISNTGKQSNTKDLPLAERRKYICKICSRGFTTSGHLARHNRIHTGEKRHQCQFPGCNQRFSRHDNYIQHYRTHFKNNPMPEEQQPSINTRSLIP